VSDTRDWNQLLARCLGGGGREAWNEFVVAAHPVIASALPPGCDVELVKDFVQSHFLRLFEDDCRRLRSFDPSLGVPFPAFLRVIAVRYRIDWSRGRIGSDLRRETDLGAVAETLGIAPDAERRLRSRELHEALERLSPQQRLATRLVLEGMSVKEVAGALALTEGGAAALLWRARQELREILGEAP
jgi:RNA polymerase sigma factor (sigma-70 family)